MPHGSNMKSRLAVAFFTVFLTQAAHAGGYVPPNGTQLKQSTSISLSGSSNIIPTFNNATLTDKNTIAEANNNVIKTPSSTDPVSTVTGNNFHDETDFVIKGRAGLNYAFTRTYNSTSSATQVDLGLGFGWVHSYGMRLKSNDYGNCPNCTSAQDPVNGNSKTSSITYTDERGGDHNYLVNESTFAVTAPQGEFDSLAFDTPTTGQHTLTFRNGTKYVFETTSGTLKSTPGVTARLKQIADPWGNQLNFTYNANGKLATVVDNLSISGRTGLTFTYDASNHLQSIADWSGRTWGYSVNASGNLATYTNPLSQVLTYGYATSTHNLTTIAKPLARNGVTVTTTFSYYQNGRTFYDANALGNTETLDYDLYRKSTRITDPRGGIRNYEYDAAGRLTKLTEPDGAILIFQNQADGLRYNKKDGLGYLTQYSYRADHTFTCPANTGGPGQAACSDTSGNVTREQDALNQTIDTTYGIYDQIATVKDKRGTILTTTFYTGSGTCIAAGKPNTVTISTLSGVSNVKLKTFCWNADGTLASQTDYLSPTDVSKTRVTTYVYDTAANLNVQGATVTGWDGATTAKSYTYDNLGRPQTETLQRRNTPTDASLINLVTTSTYDALDRVTQVQDAVGDLFISRFDANGQTWQVTHQYKKPDTTFDTRNIVTRTFDAADRVLTETDALNGVTTYVYDAAGNVIAVTDPENHTLQYQYDEMNRRTSVTDANGRTVSTAYDLAGHPISVTNGNNETTTTAYDSLGRPVIVTDPHAFVSTFAYDANNNRICVIDANAQAGLQPKNSDNCTGSTQYDELNRPTLIRDALNGTTQIAYDLLGNLLTRIDAEGRKYTWSYDGLGRFATETDFAGQTTSYLLDQASNVYQTTNRLSQVTKTTYDKLNRATNISYADSTSETVSYDPAGNPSSVANAALAYTLGYDNLNRLTNKLDSRGRSLSFSWDKSGHVLSKTTYQGSMTNYTYDGAGVLVSLTNPDYLTVNYQYDNAGRLLARVMSSGAKSLYSYDNGGWLAGMTHYDAVGATVINQSYTRDRVGNITAVNVVTGPNVGVTNYTLDALYRLTVVNAPATANDEAFSYDHLGNRLTATRGGTTIGAAGSTTKYLIYNPATQTGTVSGYTPIYNNRLKEIRIGSIGGTIDSSFTFDNEGRMTNQTGSVPRTLTWDAKSRLKTLLQGGSTETYSYDPSNHRIGRSGGSLGTLDYYLEGEHLETVEQSGAVVEKYFRGSTIDELVAGYVTQAGKLTPFFFQHDQNMSVAAETTPNGGTQASLAYFAFGETQATTGTVISRQKYTGREDEGTGLYYYRARYYDPKFGFISEDPLKFAAGANWYAYANNNPINSNDPTGMCPICIPIIEGLVELGSLARNAFTVVNAARTAATVSQAAAIGAGTSVAVGGAIRGATGQNVFDPNAITFDAAVGGVFGVGGQAYNALRIAGSSSVMKGSFAAGLAEQQLGKSVLNTEVSVSAGGARPRLDFLTQVGDDLVGVEAKYGNTALTSAQRTGYGAINAGESSSLFGTKALDLGVDGLPVSSVNILRFGALDASPSFSSYLGGAIGGAAGGFLLYPNKPNTNQVQSVYSK